MKIFRITAIAIVLLSLMAVGNNGEAKAGIIGTVDDWNGSSYVAALAEGGGTFDFATFGQTFNVVGTDNVLNKFTVYVFERNGRVDFNFNVMQWDEGSSRAIGPRLFSSSMVSTSNNGLFDEFTFNTGNLNLNSGAQYVGFISTSEYYDGETGLAFVGYVPGDVAYSDGQFVYQDNGESTDSWNDSPWGIPSLVGNLAFKAEFSAPSNPNPSVPEPASFAIFGTLCLIAGAGRRRRKS